MARPKKAYTCFACGSNQSDSWMINRPLNDQALCRACYNYYVRRPPKERTHAFRESIKERRCVECGNTDPNPNGQEKYWMRHKEKKGEYLCILCYSKLYLHQKNNPKRFKFRDHMVFLKENPRIGVCCLCRAVVGEIDAQTGLKCKLTGLHHEEYEETNPRAHTIEVCNRCHAKITHAITAQKKKQNKKLLAPIL